MFRSSRPTSRRLSTRSLRRRPFVERLEERTVPSMFTVLNTNDSGAGSLRQAILDANANGGADVIEFNIPGPGVHTISPTTQLDPITDPLTINGYSQPRNDGSGLFASENTLAQGNAAVLLIELDGSNTIGSTGLRITSDGCLIRGLVINRFGAYGIALQSDGNHVEGNFIGFGPDGAAAQSGGAIGIWVGGDNNTIGGTTGASRNVISCWNHNVVVGSTSGALMVSGNYVQGNYIGTNAVGSMAACNFSDEGIFSFGNENTTISGNLVSGVSGDLVLQRTFGFAAQDVV